MKLLIKGGRVINPGKNFDAVSDVLIEDGKIAAIGENLTDSEAQVIDATGKVVSPGFIDMHTHLREPGQEAKEDFASGSRAAAAGGFTTVATMPNTTPVVDNAILVNGLKQRAKDEGVVHIEIIGALTKGQEGKELAEVGDMTQAGAVAFSDDGHFDNNCKLMLNAMDYLRTFHKAIMSHAEETSLVAEGVMNEGHRSAMLGMKGRPTVAEDIAVMREILLAEYADAWVHISHISSKNAVDMVRQAKKRGVKVTAEATPHHLTMTDEMVNPIDSSTKVNPPLRSQADIEAVLAGVNDGTIDIIATDHSPHAQEEKDREYKFAPSGFPGLETALGVLLTDLYHKGLITLDTLVNRMSYMPGKLFFDGKRGILEEGAMADITIFDPEKEWTVDKAKFYTKGSHSPFVGRTLKGKAVMTIVEGKIVMNDGEVLA
jgi:dihydroorotase